MQPNFFILFWQKLRKKSEVGEGKQSCLKTMAGHQNPSMTKENIQVEPGKPGAEVSKKKNYKSKKVFAYRMCTG